LILFTIMAFKTIFQLSRRTNVPPIFTFTFEHLNIPHIIIPNKKPRGRAVGVSPIGKRYAKLGFYLLLPTATSLKLWSVGDPAPLQRGLTQRDAFGKGYFGVSCFYKLFRPKGSEY